MQPNDFFVAGGTLRPQSPSYVQRPADDALLEHLLAGEFCYVLTPRQMGKSSLMVRTAARLREQDIQTVIIDLTSIGTVAIDEWYLGLLSRIRNGLRLDVDVQAWWQSQAVGAAQRITTFLRDEVLGKSEGRIVIFIDEIDSTLNLDFRDDFFAAVRALYNARATEPIYQRITFAFLGVATPTELIQDRERTPFNIGRRIDLQEFTLEDARPLQEGLESMLPTQGEPLLRRIFHWTSGHPYLTQKLCLSIANHPEQEWKDSAVDQLVEQSFLSEEGRKDTNLAYVQDRILSSPATERRAQLTLYRQVYNGKRLPDDDRSPVQNRLELYGLLKVRDKLLHVRNEIYRRVFDGEWITANTPVNTQRRTAIGAVVISFLLVSFSLLYFVSQPTPGCDVFRMQFLDNPETQTVRISALASLFSQGCDDAALKLFYDLTKPEQKKLFLFENAQSVQIDLRTVVDELALTLDWSEDEHDLKLMDIMRSQLWKAGVAENDQVVQMLQHWKNGRSMVHRNNSDSAVNEYKSAILMVQSNPVLYYDRAMAYIEQGNLRAALTDLDEVIRIAQLAPATATANPTLTLSPTITTLPVLASTLVTQNGTTFQNSLSTKQIIVTRSPITPTIMDNPVMSTTNIYSSRFLHRDSLVIIVEELLRKNPKMLALINKSAYPNLYSSYPPEALVNNDPAINPTKLQVDKNLSKDTPFTFNTFKPFELKHLREVAGEMIYDSVSYNQEEGLDNSNGTAPIQVQVQFERSYRFQVISRLASNTTSTQQVLDWIVEMYQLPPNDPEGEIQTAVCPINIVIPPGQKASIIIGWMERWAEGVINAGKEDDVNRLGVYRIFLGYDQPCDLVEQVNIDAQEADTITGTKDSISLNTPTLSELPYDLPFNLPLASTTSASRLYASPNRAEYITPAIIPQSETLFVLGRNYTRSHLRVVWGTGVGWIPVSFTNYNGQRAALQDLPVFSEPPACAVPITTQFNVYSKWTSDNRQRIIIVVDLFRSKYGPFPNSSLSLTLGDSEVESTRRAITGNGQFLLKSVRFFPARDVEKGETVGYLLDTPSDDALTFIATIFSVPKNCPWYYLYGE